MSFIFDSMCSTAFQNAIVDSGSAAIIEEDSMSTRQGILGFLLFGISVGAASQTLEDEAVS